MASKGYPGEYEKGERINIPQSLKDQKGVFVFHAGTSIMDGKLVSSGGRVLGVTAMGKDINRAVKKVYSAIEQIDFKGVHFRKDIANKVLVRE